MPSRKRRSPSRLRQRGLAPDPRNIILAGFMGSGKSTVGRTLARSLGWGFVDTDQLIEAEAACPVAEIFEKKGEAAFRDLETRIAGRIGAMRHCVIATGGGFMIREENRKAAFDAGRVIFLMASAEQIWHRIKHSSRRPLLRSEDPMAQIRELLSEREEAYNAIPDRVSTDRRTPYSIADEILRKLSG